MQEKPQDLNIKKSERAQGMAEFGISLVILLIMVAGIVDLGRAFFTLVTLHDAVQEGVTYGQICPADETGIEARLQESASDPVDLGDISTNDIQVCISTPGSEGCGASAEIGNEITVSASLQHNISTPFLGTFIGSQSFELRTSARDKILRTDCSTQ